jgi:hypothetical protein
MKKSNWMKGFKIIKNDKSLGDYRGIKKIRRKKP